MQIDIASLIASRSWSGNFCVLVFVPIYLFVHYGFHFQHLSSALVSNVALVNTHNRPVLPPQQKNKKDYTYHEKWYVSVNNTVLGILSTNITSTVIFQVCQRICFESESQLDNVLSLVTAVLM